MSLEDFGGTSFVAGEVYGLRSWNVDKWGRLEPLSQFYIWKPGVNEAICGSGRAHRAGSVLSCPCGFYAYYSPTGAHFKGQVRGIIKGHGMTNVGTKGFRCEKAEIVAFIRQPLPHNEWLFEPVTTLSLPVIILGIMALILRLTPADWDPDHGTVTIMFLILAGAATLWALIVTFATAAEDKRFFPTTRWDPAFEMVKRNYPEVPVFRSVRQALKKFPVTTPQEYIEANTPPTPETDPDFWTRRA